MKSHSHSFAILGAALAVGLAASSPVAAKDADGGLSARAMQAYATPVSSEHLICVPANGAEILGGFAAPRDKINLLTETVCGRQ